MAICATDRWAICRRPHFGCDLLGGESTQAPCNLPFALVEDENGAVRTEHEFKVRTALYYAGKELGVTKT
jgi:hypothetical protein